MKKRKRCYQQFVLEYRYTDFDWAIARAAPRFWRWGVGAAREIFFGHNSGLCDYCGETETVEHFLINCTGNGVASTSRNIKDACEKLPPSVPHLCKVGDMSPQLLWSLEIDDLNLIDFSKYKLITVKWHLKESQTTVMSLLIVNSQ